MEEKFINIHTHRPGMGISVADPCLGNLDMSGAGEVYLSLGVHPCLIGEGSEALLDRIGEAALAGRIIAVGEAGLDRTSPVPMEVQTEFLEKEVAVAVRSGIPLIIHGVRAVPELIALHKRIGRTVPWIMHGFNNRREILTDLLRHGFYISAGRHVMEGGSHISRLLNEIPLDRLFIETDNSDYRIEDIYRRVAEVRGMEVKALKQAVAYNFYRIFDIGHGREH